VARYGGRLCRLDCGSDTRCCRTSPTARCAGPSSCWCCSPAVRPPRTSRLLVLRQQVRVLCRQPHDPSRSPPTARCSPRSALRWHRGLDLPAPPHWPATACRECAAADRPLGHRESPLGRPAHPRRTGAPRRWVSATAIRTTLRRHGPDPAPRWATTTWRAPPAPAGRRDHGVRPAPAVDTAWRRLAATGTAGDHGVDVADLDGHATYTPHRLAAGHLPVRATPTVVPDPRELSTACESGVAAVLAGRILVAAAGLFDGLAHEPRRHGVRPVGVISPGRSGGPVATSAAEPVMVTGPAAAALGGDRGRHRPLRSGR
jgi:hypothetical protein